MFAASGCACAALLVLTIFSNLDSHATGGTSRNFMPKEGEVVAIRATSTGNFLEVSQLDGRLRATGGSKVPTNQTALFRVMLLSAQTVDILIDSHTAPNTAK